MKYNELPEDIQYYIYTFIWPDFVARNQEILEKPEWNPI
jgi:hypothetical protein